MIIERKEYLNKLITWKDKQLIKIVTGVRRCGKSVLLKMYQDYLKNNGVKESQIVTINFEDFDYEELTNYKNYIIIYNINYICLFDYLFISSQMSAKPYFIGSTGILLLW